MIIYFCQKGISVGEMKPSVCNEKLKLLMSIKCQKYKKSFKEKWFKLLFVCLFVLLIETHAEQNYE